jgi:hypothetical protein
MRLPRQAAAVIRPSGIGRMANAGPFVAGIQQSGPENQAACVACVATCLAGAVPPGMCAIICQGYCHN